MIYRVRVLIAEMLGIEDASEVLPTSDIIADLGADSLDFIEIVMALEEEFKVALDDDFVAGVRTPEDFVAKIKLAPKL